MQHGLVLLCLALAALAPLAANALSEFRTDPASGLVVDTQGRRRIFHGVNAVEKLAPYIPPTASFDTVRSLTQKDMSLLRSWGMNVIRLGVLWVGALPDGQTVNTTYLSQISELIEDLAQNNIYTIVDAHQDVMNPYMCGEGMPTPTFHQLLAAVHFNESDPKLAFPAPWDFKFRRDSQGIPNIQDCQQHGFFDYYLTYENEALWGALYHHPQGAKAFGDSWAAVAAALANTKGVLAYELLNEPWPAGKGVKDFVSDTECLLPLYQALASRIRAVDDDRIIMFEPVVLESYESVVNKTTDFPYGGIEGVAYRDRQVYAYHIYCPSAASGAPSPWALCKDVIIPASWGGVARDLKRVGLGGFLTEFGAVGNDTLSVALINAQVDNADSQLQSWTYWTYKGFDDITTQNVATESFFNADGSLQLPKIKALSRTYAQAICGAPTVMQFDAATGNFVLQYVTLQGVTGNTEIFLSKQFFYQSGYTVQISPAGAATYSEGDFNILEVTHAPSLPANTEVTITITPK